MSNLPRAIGSVEELEDLLSRPCPALIEFLKGLPGDIMILGAGGKTGPTIARMAQRAATAAGTARRVIAVARRALPQLEKAGITTINADLLDLESVRALPRAPNVIYLVGRKFGATGNEPLTWATNVTVPYHVASTFLDSRIVVLSTGCVYPVMELATGGATEETAPDPVGEYAMSCLGRERMFDFFSEQHGEKVVHIRLNYAVEMRYGVLVDVAMKVWREEPVDVTTGYANVIWQGDAAHQILRSLEVAACPATALNVTGPETVSIRQAAHRFAEIFGKAARIAGVENGRGYLSNATRANHLFGNPAVPLGTVMEWTVAWVRRGGESLDKPTHFESQDGTY